MQCKLVLDGIAKSELLIHIHSNDGSELLYRCSQGHLSQLQLTMPNNVSNSDMVAMKIDVGDTVIEFESQADKAVLFHIMIQKCELDHPHLIYKRPHMVAIGIILQEQVSAKSRLSRIKLGLNSNYMKQGIPFNASGLELVVVNRVNFRQIIRLPTLNAVNPISKFYLTKFRAGVTLPLVPVWMIEGVDMGSRDKALSYGVPINFLYRVLPSEKFVTLSYLWNRFTELCKVYQHAENHVLRLFELYPENTPLENQFCEGIVVKLATSEVTTRPYLQDFQRVPNSAEFIETDYYLFYNYMIGDCAFDAHVIYRIWMTILFAEFDSPKAEIMGFLKTLRQMVAKIGVPVIFKGQAGGKNLFGHMFAGLVDAKHFEMMTKLAGFRDSWIAKFDLSVEALEHSHRREFVIIGEGTTPSTTHYNALQKSNSKIHFEEKLSPYYSAWTLFTHPIHVSDAKHKRFHQLVNLMISWAHPLVTGESIPTNTVFCYNPPAKCQDIQENPVPPVAIPMDASLDESSYNQYQALFETLLYLPPHQLHAKRVDYHRYPSSVFESRLQDLIIPEGPNIHRNGDNRIQKLVYVYDLDEENAAALNTELQNYEYTVTTLGYSTVITIL